METKQERKRQAQERKKQEKAYQARQDERIRKAKETRRKQEELAEELASLTPQIKPYRRGRD